MVFGKHRIVAVPEVQQESKWLGKFFGPGAGHSNQPCRQAQNVGKKKAPKIGKGGGAGNTKFGFHVRIHSRVKATSPKFNGKSDGIDHTGCLSTSEHHSGRWRNRSGKHYGFADIAPADFWKRMWWSIFHHAFGERPKVIPIGNRIPVGPSQT